MDGLSLFGPAEFKEETPLEAVSPSLGQFDPDADVRDIIPHVKGNLDQLGTNDPNTLSADPAPNPLINSRELTHGMDPAKTAKVMDLSRKTGLPPRVVEQNLGEMERRQTISDEKLDLIQNQSPKTAALLSDPNFFAVAQDDIDRLAALEGTISQYNPGFWERLGAKWEESTQQLDDGIRGFALGSLASYVRLADDEEAGGFVPNAGVKAIRELAREALAHVQAKHDLEVEKRSAKLLPADGSVQQYLEDFVGASAPILATIGLSAVGSPYAGAAFRGTQIAGGDYLSRKEQGASDLEAFGSGLADAALQAPLEALSLGKFFNIFKASGGAQILKNVGVAMGTEFTTEFLQKFPEDLTEDLALASSRGQDVWEAAGTFLDGMGETTRAGLYEGLLSLPWAILGGAGQVMRDYSNLQASEQEQSILDSLTQDLSQTNLAQIDPVLFQEAVKVLGQGTPIENIFIPSSAFEALYGQDLAGQTQVLTSLGISQEAYQSAVSTGDELVVPLGNYAATIAAVPDFAAKIAQDRKLSKDGYTRNEWVEAQQALMETYQNTVRLADEETQARTQEETETKAIYEDALALRQQAGRVQDAARSDALQLATFMTNLAKRSEGKYTPTELWEAYKPKVTAGQSQVDDQSLHQVPPDVARSLNYETRLPEDPLFAEAVANTPGAELLGDGVELDLTRYQKEEQTGDTSVRTGIFYLPTGSAQEKHYRGGKNSYGGTVKVQGRTLLRAPLFVKGATGGKAPEAAFNQIFGKKTYENMRSEVLSAISGWGLKEQAKVQNIRALLDKYDASTVDAYEIYRNSQQGNTLAYAIQENIVAHAVRKAGYDSVVGYSKKKDGGAFISEVFDVREMTNPDEDGYTDINDAFYQTPTTVDPFDTTGDWATQELGLEEGIAPAGEVINTLKARAAELQKLVECMK